MTTLRRCSEMNTGNYDFLGLPYPVQSLVAAAQAAHELVLALDMSKADIAVLGIGEDEQDDEPAMEMCRDLSNAWDLWQRLEKVAAPILARALDDEEPVSLMEDYERREAASRAEGEAFSNTGIDALLKPENWPEWERRKAQAFGEAEAHGVDLE